MAMYHFRLKSDKKPNGTKISAVKHVEYINREGAFSDDEHGKGNDKFVGNFITTEKSPNALGGQNIILYKTNGFGLIRNTEQGIEVMKNASETTIATALLLAAETMNHQPLIIKGSEELKKEVLKTAVLQDLPISFDDLLMQIEFMRNKFVDYPERKKLAVETAHKILERLEKKQTLLNHTLSISTGKEHMRNEVNVFFMLIGYRNGRRTTQKNFSKPQIGMKEQATADTWKLSLPCQMS